MTRKELEYLHRLKHRATVLHARVDDMAERRPNYVNEWERELHALEWAINKLDPSHAAQEKPGG